MFRALHARFRSRRRHEGADAKWRRADLSRSTEPTVIERLWRALRRREEFGYDEGEAKFGDAVRLMLLCVFAGFWFWFFVRSAMAVNIFAG